MRPAWSGSGVTAALPAPRPRPDADGPSPTEVYEGALRSAAGQLWLRRQDGGREPLPVHTWRGGLSPGDGCVLRRCAGPVLDVGCGPGRLAAALAARGIPALGIDVAPFAVALARRAGATALCRDVFGPVPGAGRWSTLLLADGNIGIGGDPAPLLARAATLLGPAGQLLVELDASHRAAGTQQVRLEGPDGQVSRPFPWSFVGPDEIGQYAAAAGLMLTETWHGRGRSFVTLRRLA